MDKTRVIIIDDSALIRQVLTVIINSAPDLEVIATAPNPLLARDKIRTLNPDVITLDIEMPEMNGLDFLEKLMTLRPTPVLMISSLTERGGELTLRALELGAVDFVTKPTLNVEQSMNDYAEMICDKLRMVARAKVKKLDRHSPTPEAIAHAPLPLPTNNPTPTPKRIRRTALLTTEKLIAVGASTGGTEAIQEFLLGLPPTAPGILITQHMPERFTRSFAERLDRTTQLNVVEATDGQRILPGHVYIAPGHSHLLLRRSGAHYLTALSDAPPVNRHRPSVDVLFNSVAQEAGANAMGIILTGMGRDGAAGLLAMRETGSITFAQDEDSCVVFGMPREAILLGAADEVLPLNKIAAHVMRRLG